MSNEQIPPRRDLMAILAKVELDLDNIDDPEAVKHLCDRIDRTRQWMKADRQSQIKDKLGNQHYLELWNRGKSVKINGIMAEHLSRDDLLAVVGWQSKLLGSRFLVTGS